MCSLPYVAFVLVSPEYVGLFESLFWQGSELTLHHLHFGMICLFIYYIVVPYIEMPQV
jgi:hypothetical protein